MQEVESPWKQTVEQNAESDIKLGLLMWLDVTERVFQNHNDSQKHPHLL
jgi:hypothetical protein